MSPEAPQGETKPVEYVTNMTPERIVFIAAHTHDEEVLRKLRIELLRRSANVPEGQREMILEQAYAIVDSHYSDLLAQTKTTEL